VTVIACVCPPKGDDVRHPDGDTVNLREKLGFRSALTARNEIVAAKEDDDDVSTAAITAVLTETFLLLGIESWTLVDAKGKPIEPSKQTIRDFMEGHPDEAMEVGDDAFERYQEAVVAPLVARASNSSTISPPDASTSPTTGSGRKPRKQSKPFLTTTSRTDAIETTSLSPVGVSN
jgi:hypothetical protein